MDGNIKITKEMYTIQKLSAKVAELEKKQAETEFAALLLQEENTRLKKELQETSNQNDESEKSDSKNNTRKD